MGFYYEVFSKSQTPIKLQELKDKFLKRGWCAIFVHWEKKRPIAKDETPNSFLVYAWKENSLTQNEVEKLTNDDDYRKKLFVQELIGYCEVYITYGYKLSDEYSQETIEEMFNSDDKEYREHLKSVKTKYETRTSSGRNNLSYDVQEEFAAVIARLCGGLLIDPQSGEHEFY